ncbi:MAG: ATP synthase F1 subunit delta [Bacillota bacterium]|nr:ATP synthase F1 subunit delta [Bacillota bacterium]
MESPAARPYGEALLALALEKGTLTSWTATMQKLLPTLTEDVLFWLRNPTFPEGAKNALLHQLAGNPDDPLLRNFFALVVARGRAGQLPDMIRRFLRLAKEKEGLVEVTVEVAAPLDEEKRAEVREAAGRLLGRPAQKVLLSWRVRPELLGGLRLRVEDRTYDASLRGRLQHMKRVLTQKNGRG